MKTKKVKIVGIVPLIMHNGQMADPLNQYARNLKEITGKRTKTDDDQYDMAEIEWKAGLYLKEGSEATLVIPTYVIEAMLQSASAKIKGITKKDAAAAFFLDEDAEFSARGWDESSLAANYEFGGKFVLRSLVRVGNAKVARTRPYFSSWECEFTINYDEEICDERMLDQLLEIAGNRIGLCDWRPKFGRFAVV